MKYLIIENVILYLIAFIIVYFECKRYKRWQDIKKTKWYKNCKRRRKEKAKICYDCPFKKQIENIEKTLYNM